MVSSATSLSPFLCSLGYQPPLFPSQETEAVVSSVWAHLHRCRRVWKAARDTMTTNRDRVQWVANRQRVPAPAYHPGQRVWLLARDLPLPTISQKLAPHYVGPYTIAQVINPSALRLTLPPPLSRSIPYSMCPRSSRWPPVVCLSLPLPSRPLVPSRGAIWSGRSTGSLRSVAAVGGSTTWWTGWVMGRRTARGFPAPTSRIQPSWRNSTGPTHRTVARGLPPPSLPAFPRKRAGGLISSPVLISDTCTASTLPTRTRQNQQSGQKCS